MKRLNHTEWQLIVSSEEALLKEHLNLVTSGQQDKSQYESKMADLAKLKMGGTTCHGCTLDKSLPH